MPEFNRMDMVKIKNSPYPQLFPVGETAIIWDWAGKNRIKPYGIVLESDNDEDPRVGWFEGEDLELIARNTGEGYDYV